MNVDKTFPNLPVADIAKDVHGKRIAIIGGTGGLGRAISRLLAQNGAELIVVGQTFRDAEFNNIHFIKADISLMKEVKRIAPLIPAESLDMLIFTTGIFAAPKRQETAEGIERDMATSYLNRKLLLELLVPRLGSEQVQKPRVFIMGYPGSGKPGILGDLNAERGYSVMDVHMNTVAGNEMLVLNAAEKYQHFSVFGLNPGLVNTNIRQNFVGGNKWLFNTLETIIGWFTPTADQYAARIIPLLFSTVLDQFNGSLFNHKRQALLPTKGIQSREHMQAYLAQSQQLIERALSK